MRRFCFVALLALIAGVLVAPASAQALTCNGQVPSMTGDLVYGTEGPDVIVGTPGDDRIYAEAGDDTICGLGGDDTIDPGPGDDFVDGGEGSDWLEFYEFAAAATTVDLPAGTATGGEGTDELVVGSLENVMMNCSNGRSDTLIGDADDNTLSGGTGADSITGGAGNDLIYGTDPSVGRTDAICWFSDEPDDDDVQGGEGDDILLGQVGMDDLDGGAGWDIVDGGQETDFCTRGERYANCETQQTPAPPAQCSDGSDNDDDGAVDESDQGCSHPGDPREDVADDPNCNDGRDNDGDGRIDFSADHGCTALADETELDDCVGPCPPTYLTIEYKPRLAMFRGKAVARPSECATDRLVVLRKKRDGRDRTLGRDRTNRRGVWKIDNHRRPRGRYYVVARRTNVALSGGEIARCPRLRSPEMRIQGSYSAR